MGDNEVTILMVYALVADTWGTCIIATTRVVVLAKCILSPKLSQACPSIDQTTSF